MRHPERTFNPDSLIDIRTGAQEFHETLMRREAVVIHKSGKVSEDVFMQVFNYMGEQSLQGAYKNQSRKPILYLPIHFTNKNLMMLVSKQGLPSFNLRLARIAAGISQWVARDIHAIAMRRNVPEVHGATNDQERIIASMLNYDMQFSNTDYAAHVIRKGLTRFGNPATPLDTNDIPTIIPLFNMSERLPDNFDDILGGYTIHGDMTYQDRTTALLSQSIVDFTYHMYQSHGLRQPTQYVLAGDLRPFDLFTERYDEVVEPWLGWGPNSELAYAYRSMKIVEI